MKPPKTIATVVRRFQKSCPTSNKALRGLGLTAKYLDSGAFRDSYKIKELPLVVKFPIQHDSNLSGNIRHAQGEMAILQKIKRLRRYRMLRTFIPKVYFYDKKTGVVLMHYYKQLSYTDSNNRLCNLIEQFICSVLYIAQHRGVDIKPANVGYDQDPDYGQYIYKVFDLGCVKRAQWE